MTILGLTQSGAFILAGVAGISFLVGFHELGHFLFCKLFNIHTPSFSIGFGPRLISKKIGDTLFSFSAIPLGGYVEIAGMEEVGQGEQKEAHRKDSQSFRKKPYYQKMLVIAGGIIFNMAFAYIILTALFMAGMPQNPFAFAFNSTPTIDSVLPELPAARAGIQPGDTIVSVNNIDAQNGIPALLKEFRTHSGPNAVVLQRRDLKFSSLITVDTQKQGPLLGVTFVSEGPQSVLTSVKKGIQLTNFIACETFSSIVNMFKKRSLKGAGGPIAIIQGVSQSAQGGLAAFLLFLCFISINLAVLNVLPLPIFDGGQALFYTIEAVTGKSADNIRVVIHYISWFLVLGLIVYLSYKDIVRIIFGA